jgi:hypothetical protein
MSYGITIINDNNIVQIDENYSTYVLIGRYYWTVPADCVYTQLDGQDPSFIFLIRASDSHQVYYIWERTYSSDNFNVYLHITAGVLKTVYTFKNVLSEAVGITTLPDIALAAPSSRLVLNNTSEYGLNVYDQSGLLTYTSDEQPLTVVYTAYTDLTKITVFPITPRAGYIYFVLTDFPALLVGFTFAADSTSITQTPVEVSINVGYNDHTILNSNFGRTSIIEIASKTQFARVLPDPVLSLVSATTNRFFIQVTNFASLPTYTGLPLTMLMSLTTINPATGLVVNSSMLRSYNTTTGLITITGQATSGRVYTLGVTCRASGLYLFSNKKTLTITVP